VSVPAQARGWFGLIYRHDLIYNQCGNTSESCREWLDFDAHRARQLHAPDRVATYGSFHIARLAPA